MDEMGVVNAVLSSPWIGEIRKEGMALVGSTWNFALGDCGIRAQSDVRGSWVPIPALHFSSAETLGMGLA